MGSQIAAVTCPACRVEVVSPSLSVPEILDRHLRHCRWEPGMEMAA